MILVFHSPSSGILYIAARPLIVAPSNSLHNNTRRKLWTHACPLYRSYYSPSIIVSGQIHVLHNTIPLKWHAKILGTAIAQLLLMSISTSSPEPTMQNLTVCKEWWDHISKHAIDRIADYSPMHHDNYSRFTILPSKVIFTYLGRICLT